MIYGVNWVNGMRIVSFLVSVMVVFTPSVNAQLTQLPTIVVNNRVLQITGTDQPDLIVLRAIHPIYGSFFNIRYPAAGQDPFGFIANWQETSVAMSRVDSVEVRLGEGTDQLNVYEYDNTSDLFIDMGPSGGDPSVRQDLMFGVQHQQFGNVTIELGDNCKFRAFSYWATVNWASEYAGNLSVSGDGDNDIWMDAVRTEGDLAIDLASGSNLIRIMQKNEFGGDATIRCGSGQDELQIESRFGDITHFRKSLDVNLGNGRADVSFVDARFDGALSYSGGSGRDFVSLTDCNFNSPGIAFVTKGNADSLRISSSPNSPFAVHSDLSIAMGGGTDELLLDHVVFLGSVAIKTSGTKDTSVDQVIANQVAFAGPVTSLETGNGSDFVFIQESKLVGDWFSLSTGPGTDVVQIDQCDGSGAIAVDLGSDDDEISLLNNEFRSPIYPLIVAGGIGDDTCENVQSSFELEPELMEFERIFGF